MLKRYNINAMKLILTVIAWLGIFILIIFFYFYSNQVIDTIRLFRIITPDMIVDPPAFGWVIFGGTLFALIGGLTARPHLVWPILVIVGVIYSALAIINISLKYLFPSSGLMYLIIGLVCIIEGLLIRWFRIRKQKTHHL
jgi:hypothetical protein